MDRGADGVKKLHYFETCYSLLLLLKNSQLTEEDHKEKIESLGLHNDADAHSKFIPNLFEFYQQCIPLMNKQNIELLEDMELNLFKFFSTEKLGSSWMLFYHKMSSLKHWSAEKIVSKCFGNDTNLSTFIDDGIKHGIEDKKSNMDSLYHFIQYFLPYLSQNPSVYPASLEAVLDLLQSIDLFHDSYKTHELFQSCLKNDNILEQFITRVESVAKESKPFNDELCCMLNKMLVELFPKKTELPKSYTRMKCAVVNSCSRESSEDIYKHQ